MIRSRMAACGLASALLLAALAACGSSKPETQHAAVAPSPIERHTIVRPPSDKGYTIDPAAILAAHNRLRARHRVQPLSWSPELAESAQGWANKCDFEHSDTQGRYGENLVMWTGGGGPETRVDSWYKEISDYDFSTHSKRRSSAMIGHFTQVVWAETQTVGCGLQFCPGLGNLTYMVCQYAPPGNVRGAYGANVYLPG